LDLVQEEDDILISDDLYLEAAVAGPENEGGK
jgi:hypothetical protein